MTTSGHDPAAKESIDLTDRVVLVTGGASGIGEQVVRKLITAGAHPVILDANAAAIERVSGELEGVLAFKADITAQADVDQAVDATLGTYGRIDALVNNAGVSLHEPVDVVDPERLQWAFNINVVGALRMLQAVLPTMRAAKFGRIVNVISGTIRFPVVGAGPYSATKAALNQLSAVARAELADSGITVSEVLPSMTASNFNGGSYVAGKELMPGVVVQTAEYPARAILRAITSGEATLDVPHGSERADYLSS